MKIILITGASGSGKTFISKYLAEKYKVFYFDDIGVPSVDEMVLEYGGAEEWQKSMVQIWIEKLLALKDHQILILEGSFNPEFAVSLFQQYHFNNYKIICLHANKVVRDKRLIHNRKQPELANQDMENFANVLKEKTLNSGGVIIDTSGDVYEIVKRCFEEIDGVDLARREVLVELALSLVKEQFHQYSGLEIRPVKYGGWDNATFHLGETMLLRIPRGEAYALKVAKEHNVLKKLRSRLSVNIPKPIFMGHPSKRYPWHWSIYEYLDGDSANSILLSDQELEGLAHDLGVVLNELHKIDITDAPLPGLHNYWRGEHISVYENGALRYFVQLEGLIDSEQVLSIWKKAVITKWQNSPLWIHGDLASSNILVKDGKLYAVIDFGGCAQGDPACDLMIAWMFFKGKSRQIFKNTIKLNEDTWLRAKAWALWKSSFELVNIADKSSIEALKYIEIIKEITKE
ncbi:MAG: phosphotransferase [Rickettsiales bacterium]|nr:phosphotransferase [Rickettsiales bacterium]